MARFWLSWYQSGPDHRPLTFPPNEAILGWWCTGSGNYAGREVYTLCALVKAACPVEAWDAVEQDWPDMVDRRFTKPQDQKLPH